jgi:hypothetical protein
MQSYRMSWAFAQSANQPALVSETIITMPKRVIQKSQAISDPTIIWNTFIDLIAERAEDLDPEQRPAHFVLIYDFEVQNGGHLQYFYNHAMHI